VQGTRARIDAAHVTVIASANARLSVLETSATRRRLERRDECCAADGRAVEDGEHGALSILGLAQKGIDAVVDVVGGHPFEPSAIGIELVKARLRLVEAIELADEKLQLTVQRRFAQKVPSKLRSCDHSRRWPNSPPMKSNFLPGCAHIYA